MIDLPLLKQKKLSRTYERRKNKQQLRRKNKTNIIKWINNVRCRTKGANSS